MQTVDTIGRAQQLAKSGWKGKDGQPFRKGSTFFILGNDLLR